MKRMIELLKEKFMNRRFLSFGLIGVVNTILAQLIYMLFVTLGVQVSAASVLGDVLSMAFSYVMNMRFTYHEKMSWKSAAAFPLSYVPGITINAAAVWIISDILHMPKLWAKAIALPFAVPINFLCMNLIVKKFSKKESAR